MTRSLEQLRFAPYTPGDEAAIVACWQACFDLARSEDAWRAQFLANPAGLPVVALARDGGDVVAQATLLTRRLRAHGVELTAGQSIDAMTRPAWQRMGLGRRLANDARDQAVARGFGLTYGFSNEESTHGILKYQGRRAVRPFPVLVRPLRPIGSAVALLRAKFGHHLPWLERVAPVDAARTGPAAPAWTPPWFDARHADVFDNAELPPITVVRDVAHLAWRYPSGTGSYLQHDVPARHGPGLDAFAVVRIEERFGLRLIYLMEWLFRRGAAASGRRLLRDVCTAARAMDCHGVVALAAPGSAGRRALLQSAFVAVPERLFPGTLVMSVRTEHGDLAPELVGDMRNWHLSWGDLDVL